MSAIPLDITQRRTLRRGEIATVYGLSRTHVGNLIRDGKLPVTRVGRLTMVDIADADRLFGVSRTDEPVLTGAARVSLRERVLALPVLTDEQIDALADVVVAIRRRKPLQGTAPGGDDHVSTA